jgi:hypothetical protein
VSHQSQFGPPPVVVEKCTLTYWPCVLHTVLIFAMLNMIACYGLPLYHVLCLVLAAAVCCCACRLIWLMIFCILWSVL